jgi:hypothetical protein
LFLVYAGVWRDILVSIRGTTRRGAPAGRIGIDGCVYREQGEAGAVGEAGG